MTNLALPSSRPPLPAVAAPRLALLEAATAPTAPGTPATRTPTTRTKTTRTPPTTTTTTTPTTRTTTRTPTTTTMVLMLARWATSSCRPLSAPAALSQWRAPWTHSFCASSLRGPRLPQAVPPPDPLPPSFRVRHLLVEAPEPRAQPTQPHLPFSSLAVAAVAAAAAAWAATARLRARLAAQLRASSTAADSRRARPRPACSRLPTHPKVAATAVLAAARPPARCCVGGQRR